MYRTPALLTPQGGPCCLAQEIVRFFLRRKRYNSPVVEDGHRQTPGLRPGAIPTLCAFASFRVLNA